jgi:hypothetical protein
MAAEDPVQLLRAPKEWRLPLEDRKCTEMVLAVGYRKRGRQRINLFWLECPENDGFPHIVWLVESKKFHRDQEETPRGSWPVPGSESCER